MDASTGRDITYQEIKTKYPNSDDTLINLLREFKIIGMKHIDNLYGCVFETVGDYIEDFQNKLENSFKILSRKHINEFNDLLNLSSEIFENNSPLIVRQQLDIQKQLTKSMLDGNNQLTQMLLNENSEILNTKLLPCKDTPTSYWGKSFSEFKEVCDSCFSNNENDNISNTVNVMKQELDFKEYTNPYSDYNNSQIDIDHKLALKLQHEFDQIEADRELAAKLANSWS